MNILVVDDNAISGRMLQQILRHSGHHVTFSQSAEVALDVLSAHPEIDLLVCDLRMPDVDGLELVRRVRANENGTRMPIIMCTAASDRISVADAVSVGCDAYVLKPIRPEVLLARIASVMPPVPVPEEEEAQAAEAEGEGALVREGEGGEAGQPAGSAEPAEPPVTQNWPE